MIASTQSYLNYKKQNEEFFEFLVLICYAVPAYKAQLNHRIGGNASLLPRADHFSHDTTSDSELLRRAQLYKKRLGCHMMLSTFSYFESFFAAALTEMFDFQGGKEVFLERARKNTLQMISKQRHNNLKKSLQEPAKPVKRYKYEDCIKKLEAQGFRFPSDLLAPFGLKHLMNQVGERNFKPVMIPDLLTECLGMSVPQKRLDEFTRLREKRNRIAHGKLHEFDLSTALDAYDFLKVFANDIDKHLVDTFFVLELYR